MFRGLCIAVAVLCGLASCAKHSPGAVKAGRQLLCFEEKGLTGNVCSYTNGGFHIVCDAVPWTDAAAGCASFGYQQGYLNNENLAAAIDVYNMCLGGQTSVWVGAYDGYSEDPCMWMDSFTRIFMADPVCPLGLEYVPLCQEYFLTNATSTVTVSTTVTRGISTVVLPTYDPAHCQSPWARGADSSDESSSSSSSDESSLSFWSDETSSDHHWRPFDSSSSNDGRFIEKSMEQERLCPVNVCGLEVGRFRVIDSNLSQNCTLYGWRFADVTTGDMESVARLFAACRGLSSNIFIRSYNGISGTCAMLYQSSVQDWPQIMILNDVEQCAEFGGRVLCDTLSIPAYTGSGVASALTSTTTTWTTTVTTTSSVPTLTSTLTSFAPTP